MGQIYLHIGLTKTGSSAIQAFLTLNKKVLEENGFKFPNSPDINNGQPFQTTSGNGDFFIQLLRNGKNSELEEILQSYSVDEKDVIISSEGIIYLLNDYYDEVAALIDKFNMKIIFYIRRQDEHLISEYNQGIKNHGLDREIKLCLYKYKSIPQVIAEKLVEQYSKNEMIIRPYEKKQFKNNNIYDDFLDCLGLELTDSYQFPNEIVNHSLSMDTLLYKRNINKFLGNILANSLPMNIIINKYLLDYTVYEKGEGKAFSQHNLLSKKDREATITRYEELNTKIARDFLNREDGILFYEELPNDESLTGNDISIDEYLKITQFIMKSKSPEHFEEYMNELDCVMKDSIVKYAIKMIFDGTDYKIFEENTDNLNSVEILNLIYELNSKPLVISSDVDKIEYIENKLYISSSGNDPFFELPNFHNAEFTDIKIVIDIEANKAFYMQIFYEELLAGYNEKKSYKFKVPKSRNNISVNISSSEVINKIRIDIGDIVEKYVINSIKIFEA